MEFDTGAWKIALERYVPERPERAATAEELHEALTGCFLAFRSRCPTSTRAMKRSRKRGVDFLGSLEVMPWGGVLAALSRCGSKRAHARRRAAQAAA